MSSPLPVPSKAALTALRGLIVGTSCTLVLVTEDRRRRINNAHDALRNAARIKSAKRYHGGGLNDLPVLSASSSEAEAEAIHWKNHNGTDARVYRRGSWMEIRPRDALDEMPSQPGAHHVSTVSAGQAEAGVTPQHIPSRAPLERPPIPPFIQPLPERPWPLDQHAGRIPRPRGEAGASRETGAALAEVYEASGSRDAQRLQGAVDVLLGMMKPDLELDDPNRPLLPAITRLSLRLQEVGLMEPAQRLLSAVAKNKSLAEADYYALNPLAVVGSLLSAIETGPGSQRSENVKRLDLAAKLFCPRFKAKPTTQAQGLVETGALLLERAFELKHTRRAEDIFERSIVGGGDAHGLTGRFIAQLYQYGEYKAAVRHFLLFYSHTSPTSASFLQAAPAVIRATAAANDYRAGAVLQALLQTRPEGVTLRPRWVIDLLYGHWRRYHDLDTVKTIFGRIVREDVRQVVGQPEGLYRVMVQISLDAGDAEAAETYYAELTSIEPSQQDGAGILQYFAQARARGGDWDGARAEIEKMRPGERTGKAIAPIIKEHLKSHTIGETEAYLRIFVDELHVPITRHLVTLMASEYGALRDVEAFLGWLEYCSQAGYEVDSVFSKLILVGCKKRWHFSFRELEKVHGTLAALNPAFVDESTTQVMRHAAVSDPTLHGRVALGRLGRLKRHGISDQKPTGEEDTLIAMKEALILGKPKDAIAIYRRASRAGFLCSPYCLRLAVRARLQLDGPNLKPTADLLRRAQQDGQDIGRAALPILVDRFNQAVRTIGRTPDMQVRKALGDIISSMESGGLRLPGRAFNQAAAACLRVGDALGALSYAKMAMTRNGQSEPRDSTSFGLLFSAYMALGDVRGVRSIISCAVDGGFGHEHFCLDVLKAGETLLAKAPPGGSWRRLTKIVQDGIERVKGLRQDFAAEKQTLERESLRIMREAAVNAAGQPADAPRLQDFLSTKEASAEAAGVPSGTERPAHAGGGAGH